MATTVQPSDQGSNTAIMPAAEFQALPLEFIIAAPLNGAVKAQSIVAAGIKDFVDRFGKDTVNFSSTIVVEGKETKVAMSVPTLAIVPVPHLRIDSITVEFTYEVSQIVAEKDSLEKGLECGAQTSGVLSKFLGATLKGNVSSRSSSESTVNRSGSLHVTVHASEAPMPEGLARILGVITRSLPAVTNP